ncbi:helix-turn-helix transcriptional regulator [Campylobacter canadensis]|uniref:PAS domain-containing protein n=1 Tax=Campylobacter canadensis TaxID=449520 RepID=A0ABS7WS03_9BACT|nr:PAS domain-containing protein [Campylobacter canadensis]MBZ7987156.1 PAS domain-containing protein [Campylobacter canadensis]MBZ7994490.1 PAS domain-containing protein [Campylobacter canadensis]MBZ7996423.1 PAS domain-containing protein [Campylobacter canadensis]MBZ7998220.1 PAS domain-containing protein [Campylobacter canadensis]MBZ7999795.1 PAS domain-containing protein [Campylobacter canadensis]
MNKQTKADYIKLVHFLAQALGKDYEIVLHDITEDGVSIAEIVNNHISGRSINSPITGFALELLNKKIYEERDFLSNYKASASGKNIKGSTFFIKENNKLSGMLCINYDKSRIENIAAQLLNNDSINEEYAYEEVLSLDLNELILELTGLSINEIKTTNLKPKQRQDIVDKIYEKGIFNIKGSITQIASLLNLSESSIYRCINKSKQKFS